MANRKEFINYVVSKIALIEKNNISAILIEDKLNSLTDKELKDFVNKLGKEEVYLPYYIANAQEQTIDIKRWIKLATSLGNDTFTELVQEDEVTGEVTVTDIKYWVAMWPARRHLHYLDAKRSMAVDNKTRDTLTGQVTGASKGSSFSKPQLMGLLSRGCKANAIEIFKYRGGDISGGREMNKQLISTGGVSLNSLLQTNTKPTVNKTLGSFLNGMHLAHNLNNG